MAYGKRCVHAAFWRYLLSFTGRHKKGKSPYLALSGNGASEQQIVTGLEHDGIIGYRYFSLKGDCTLSLEMEQTGNGFIEVCLDSPDSQPIATISIADSVSVTNAACQIQKVIGIHGVYLRFHGQNHTTKLVTLVIG